MKILILCTGNTCRSQMAEAFLQSFSDFIEVYSAGTQAESKVNHLSVKVMSEMGIDISTNSPTSVADFVNESFDYVITVCDGAKEVCPVFTGEVKNQLHIGFDDPAEATGTEEEKLAVFRRVRNEILVAFYAFYHTEINR